MSRSRRLGAAALTALASAATVAAAVIFLIFRSPSDTDAAARRLERILSRKVDKLEEICIKTLEGDETTLLSMRRFPSSMVVYRYSADTLQAWRGQFSVRNDDISPRQVLQRLTSRRISPRSPLLDISDSLTYVNLGPKWYLARRFDSPGGDCVIGGIVIVNSFDRRSRNNVSRGLRLQEKFTLAPLSTSEGSPVVIDGRPLFKVMCESLRPVGTSDSSRLMTEGIILVNLFLTALVLLLYFFRRRIRKMAMGSPAPWCAAAFLFSVAIPVYAGFALSAIIRNSDVTLEIYKITGLEILSAAVYFSFILLLVCVPLILQVVRPFISRRRHGKADFLRNPWKAVFALACALILTVISSSIGFRKEQMRLEVTANRLSVGRDLPLEVQLKRVENQIAEDPVVSALSALDNSDEAVLNRVLEAYFFRLPQEYSISAKIIRDSNSGKAESDIYNERIRNAEPMGEGSRFFVRELPSGEVSYTGLFLFYEASAGVSRVLLCIDPQPGRKVKGYRRLFGVTPLGRAAVPAGYSFARYAGGRLSSFEGTFAYPTTVDPERVSQIYSGAVRDFISEGYAHFVTLVSDDEAIVISRPVFGFSARLVSLLFLALIAYFFISVFSIVGRRTDSSRVNNFYRGRITTILMFFLILTLVVMAAVSVLFVYRRNEANLRTMMSERISAVQALVTTQSREQNRTPVLERVASDTGSDLTVFSPDGKVLASTVPDLYERMILGSRIDPDAHHAILSRGQRYFIHRERTGPFVYYNMYAPLIGPDGRISAILCSPYTDGTYDFEKDAVMHLMTVFVVFLILLILARIAATKVVDRMFRPLLEMGRKMSGAELGSLERIEYDRDDEISALVDSYNRMVGELSESTLTLAQAERDKAWSGMARQVAHEIKNPLTPMKLQIQRIVRLKQKGDPQWQERFDEVSKVLLDHIDILTETANEFSTFAKLYSEEATEIDIDKVLQEEIAMFDSKEGIRFDYVGLSGATVSGPKPQLTRVFVNLINNAVQAVEGIPDARVFVSLRHSVEGDGFYDIVFEDNGPGVSEENVEKLFTPNFTTKSSGSGLGLAISRSVLERCGAKIRYSRSFGLGGACFTISYPR